MSNQQNSQSNNSPKERPLHPVQLELARLLLEVALEMRRDEAKMQRAKEEENRELQKAKLQARAKRRWKRIEKLEREGRLPVYLWMVESRRMEEEVGYGLAVWYAEGQR